MVKSYRGYSFVNGLRFSCSNAIKTNKLKMIVCFLLVFTAICTGVFVAIKAKGAHELCNLREINLDDFSSGFAASSSAFFSRTFSLCANVLILSLLAFAPFLFPLSVFLLVYRGYLFGLNFALIFVFYGVGSALSAIIVVLPCQILTLFVLIMFSIVLQRINRNCKRFGGSDCNRLAFVFVVLLLLILINLIETVLLFFLSGTVILVI